MAALARALTEIVRRHEVLRTTFLNQHGRPVQHVADPAPIALPTIDLEPEDPAERERVAAQVVRGETHRPFNLAQGPLVRPLLIRFDPERHDLVVTLHHIVCDGSSLGILTHELSALYEAFARGDASPLPELPIQYADYAAWQREWLTGPTLETQRRYWLEHLAGLAAPLRLPGDHPRSTTLARAGASHDLVLSGELADGLRELSRRHGATLFMVLLAGFKALLSRYTGQEDVAIGTPLAHRNHLELEPLIGLFANTLVLRTDLGGDPTFRELLARVRETCLGAYAHPDMPFEKLVEDLHPARALGQNPLFEISFVFQGAGEWTTVSSVTVASPFELTLFVRDRPDGTLGATLQYARDLYEPETVARLMASYRMLLHGALADPDRRLSTLPLTDDAEAHRLLIDWNATAASYPRERSISACFETQVDAAPHAVALVFDGGSVTYEELDRRANRLAHHLRAAGVGAEHVVGVWMDRSPEMIVALLAVVKAGGAYAPFDLLAPPARLAAMMSIAGIDLILTREALPDPLAALGVRAISVDVEAEAIARRPAARLETSASAESLAYVMFTSGSTGEPKGVEAMHRNIVRLVKGADYASFGAEEVFLQLSSPSFDASTFEIWGALLNGGRLAIAPPGVPSVADIGDLLRRYGVTTLVAHGRPLPRDGRPPTGRSPAAAMPAGRRRCSLTGARGPCARRAAGAAPRQRLWAHRGHHVHVLPRRDGASATGPLGTDRPAHRQHPRVRARSPPPSLAHRRARRAVDRRRRPRPRLCPSAAPDRRALRAGTACARRGGAPVSDRRPRPLAGRRHARVPGAARRPGEGARPSRRARRHRGRAHPASANPGGGRRATRHAPTSRG